MNDPKTAAWQPIGTAPKDRKVDLSWGRVRYPDCYWSPRYGRWVQEDENIQPRILRIDFTHWMDIPEPPVLPDPDPPLWARLAELENENRRLRQILKEQT